MVVGRCLDGFILFSDVSRAVLDITAVSLTFSLGSRVSCFLFSLPIKMSIW